MSDPRGKEPPRLLFHNTSLNKPLRIIQNDDTLYILAHGHATQADYVANTRNVNCLMIDHTNLAVILKVAGLPMDHARVKLYICNASGRMGTFASNFKQAMRNMNFHRIDVYYYDASVAIPTEFSDGKYHKDGIFPQLTPRFRASESRQRVV